LAPKKWKSNIESAKRHTKKTTAINKKRKQKKHISKIYTGSSKIGKHMPNRRSRKGNEKKQVGCAMLNWREMLSNSNKGKKSAGSGLRLNFLLGFRCSRDLFLSFFSRKVKKNQ
jgi:hypothetical protein